VKKFVIKNCVFNHLYFEHKYWSLHVTDILRSPPYSEYHPVPGASQISFGISIVPLVFEEPG
jgi:hypothetical protein